VTRIEKIRSALQLALQPQQIEIEDDSHMHAGHAGAATGRGHFTVRIVAAAFAGQSLIARHRLVYAAVDELMQTDIHALSIRALTPEEQAAKPQA
jgi:BolA family transcriptional regulator, general stress-responsive regulator